MPRARKYNHSFTVRIDDESNENVEALMTHLGMSKGEVARLAIETLFSRVPSSTLRQIREAPPETREALRGLTKAINHIGVNVNQITRSVNALVAEGLVEEAAIDPGALSCWLRDAEADVALIRQEVSDFVCHESTALKGR